MALVQRDGAAALISRMLPKLLRAEAEKTTQANVREIAESQAPHGLISALIAMRDRPDRSRVFSALQIPAVVIVGDEDALLAVYEAEQIARTCQHATLERIADAGHLSPCEAPERFARAVTRLLDR